MKQIKLLIIIFLFVGQLSPEGFAVGTLVKIEQRYVPIERICRKRVVKSRPSGGFKLRADRVLYTYKTRVPEFVHLTFVNHTIDCALDQQFYVRALRKWATAQQIFSNTDIQALFKAQTRFISVDVIHEPIDVYIFTTKKYHNFVVSHDDILVHNLEPLFASAGMAAMHVPFIVEGATTLLSSCNPWFIAAGIAVAGSCALYNYFTSNSQNKKYARQLQHTLDEQRQKLIEKEQRQNVVSGSSGPQKDPKDKERTNDKKDEDFFENLKKRSIKSVRTNRFGKMYYDPQTDLWWSKDRAMHGSSRFKVFKKTAKSFEWVFNADEYENKILNQHKGPIGLVIPLKKVIF